MRIVFSSIVAVSLLIHAAFGCCWHHVHDAAKGAVCCDSIACGCAREHAPQVGAGRSHTSELPHAPSNERPRCQGTCQYLPGQKTQLDTLSQLSLLDLAIVASATNDVAFAAVTHSELSLDGPAQPPLRLHLFHQILLI